MTITRSGISNVNFNSPDGFSTYEVTDEKGNMLARIVYDDEQYQHWAVFVNDIEVHRTHTVMRAQNYVIWHHKQGSLPIWQNIENESETVDDEIESDQSVRLFTHVKRSLVKMTLAIVISAGTFVISSTAFGYEVPVNGRIGSPIVAKKPTEPSKPYRGGSRREAFNP